MVLQGWWKLGIFRRDSSHSAPGSPRASSGRRGKEKQLEPNAAPWDPGRDSLEKPKTTASARQIHPLSGEKTQLLGFENKEDEEDSGKSSSPGAGGERPLSNSYPSANSTYPLTPNICVEGGRIEFIKPTELDSRSVNSGETVDIADISDSSRKLSVEEKSAGSDNEKNDLAKENLEARVLELEQALEQETKNGQKDRLAVARLRRQLARREVLQRDVERERRLRTETESRLRESNSESDRYRARLSALQHEFGRMEDTVRSMLQYKSRAEQLKQEKTSLTVAYETRVHQYQNTITKLSQENDALRKQLRALEAAGAGDVPAAILERLQSLESENALLVQESESQRRQYEHCLDDIANQVVRALLTQKSLREEIATLQHRIHELEHQNRTLTTLLLQQIQGSGLGEGNENSSTGIDALFYVQSSKYSEQNSHPTSNAATPKSEGSKRDKSLDESSDSPNSLCSNYSISTSSNGTVSASTPGLSQLHSSFPSKSFGASPFTSTPNSNPINEFLWLTQETNSHKQTNHKDSFYPTAGTNEVHQSVSGIFCDSPSPRLVVKDRGWIVKSCCQNDKVNLLKDPTPGAVDKLKDNSAAAASSQGLIWTNEKLRQLEDLYANDEVCNYAAEMEKNEFFQHGAQRNIESDCCEKVQQGLPLTINNFELPLRNSDVLCVGKSDNGDQEQSAEVHSLSCPRVGNKSDFVSSDSPTLNNLWHTFTAKTECSIDDPSTIIQKNEINIAQNPKSSFSPTKSSSFSPSICESNHVFSWPLTVENFHCQWRGVPSKLKLKHAMDILSMKVRSSSRKRELPVRPHTLNISSKCHQYNIDYLVPSQKSSHGSPSRKYYCKLSPALSNKSNSAHAGEMAESVNTPVTRYAQEQVHKNSFEESFQNASDENRLKDDDESNSLQTSCRDLDSKVVYDQVFLGSAQEQKVTNVSDNSSRTVLKTVLLSVRSEDAVAKEEVVEEGNESPVSTAGESGNKDEGYSTMSSDVQGEVKDGDSTQLHRSTESSLDLSGTARYIPKNSSTHSLHDSGVCIQKCLEDVKEVSDENDMNKERSFEVPYSQPTSTILKGNICLEGDFKITASQDLPLDSAAERETCHKSKTPKTYPSTVADISWDLDQCQPTNVANVQAPNLSVNSDGHLKKCDKSDLPRKVLEISARAKFNEIEDDQLPLVEDDNDSDILYIPLEFKLFSHVANPRHSFPPARFVHPYQHIMRSFSDSHLCLKFMRALNSQSHISGDIWNNQGLPEQSSSALDISYSSPKGNLEGQPHPLRRSKAQASLGAQHDESLVCIETEFGLSWGHLSSSISTESDEGSDGWEQADYVQHWLRLDDTRSTLQYQELSLEYDQAEMEDWSMNLSSEDIPRNKDWRKFSDMKDSETKALNWDFKEGRLASTPARSDHGYGGTIGSLPSIQENNLELEEDSNECLWNSASYLKSESILDSPMNSQDQEWPYRQEQNKNWPYINEQKGQNFISPKSDRSDFPLSWSSSDRLSCCDSEQFSSEFEALCNYSCDSSSKRSSAAMSDTCPSCESKRNSKSSENGSIGEYDDSVSEPVNVGTDFTRDFYRLVKFESSKSLASSSKSLAFSDGGSLRRGQTIVPESENDVPPPDREEALQSVLNFIAEQQKYCQNREVQDCAKEQEHIGRMPDHNAGDPVTEEQVEEVNQVPQENIPNQSEKESKKDQEKEEMDDTKEILNSEMADSITSQTSNAGSERFPSDVSTPDTVITSSSLKKKFSESIHKGDKFEEEDAVMNKESPEPLPEPPEDKENQPVNNKCDPSVPDKKSSVIVLGHARVPSFHEKATTKDVIEELNRMIRKGEVDEENAAEHTAQNDSKVDEGCRTGWVHVERDIDFNDPKARANLLDVMLASSGSSSGSSGSGSCSGSESGEEPADYQHLHRLHRFRRHKKASARELGVLRYLPASRPTILGRDDFFVRYGEKEREAVASFDFLEDLSTSLSDLGSSDTLGSRSQHQTPPQLSLREELEEKECEDKDLTPTHTPSDESDHGEQLSLSDSCAASFSGSSPSLDGKD